MVKPNQVIQYLKANGVEVSGNTDGYFRLGPSGIKEWKVDGVSQPSNEQLEDYAEKSKDQIIRDIEDKMHETLVAGIQWRKSVVSSWFTVHIDKEMADFLTRTYMKLSNGRVSPHGGKLYSGGECTDITDGAMEELCMFAGCWGDRISLICQQQKAGISDGSISSVGYDAENIDWTVTWEAVDIANGWLDNKVTQTP